MNTHNRYLTIGMVVLMGLLCLSGKNLMAQEPVNKTPIMVPDLPNDDDTIVGGTDDVTFSSKIPMAGNSAVNRMLGLQTYDFPYSRYFCELEWLLGGESSCVGVNFAYVPKHIGGYCSLLGDDYNVWATLGGVWRPFAKPSGLDWQLYGGVALSGNVGYEVGTRFAANAKGNFDSGWAWISGSLGVITINGYSFTTIGISLGIICLSPFVIL